MPKGGPTDLNGEAWTPSCFKGKEEYHVFVIGDWGGMCGYGKNNDCELGPAADASWDHDDHSAARPYPMRNKRSRKTGVDDQAQQHVRNRMNQLSDKVEPEFVINVGDNFYPGGIVEHCQGDPSKIKLDEIPSQFNSTFEKMYDGKNMQKAEWLSVLGNHDYGGVCYNMGWAQQIWYTWNTASTQRWIMPAQYWSKQARFTTTSGEEISADMFFLDSNFEDTHKDPDHDLCSTFGNYHLDEGEQGANKDQKNGWYCGGFLGDGPDGWKSHADKSGQCANTKFTSRDSCVQEFQSLWSEQMRWLEKGLAGSWADWQIIVTHFPPNGIAPKIAAGLLPLARKHGVDLIVTGHTHSQHIIYKKSEPTAYDYGDTAVLISGGGGGILSEANPDDHGHDDQYGFMDLVVTKNTIKVTSYSWAHTKFGQTLLTTDYTKCAGEYRIEHFGPSGDWTKYRSANGQCLIYYDETDGWVLKEGQNPDPEKPWFCQGPMVPKLPDGEWVPNSNEGVSQCSLSFPVGDLMPHETQVVTKATPDNTPPAPSPLPSPTPVPSLPSSCKEIGCGSAYNPASSCQCNDACGAHNSCCADYSDCPGTVV